MAGRSSASARYYCPGDGTELKYGGYYYCPMCKRDVDVKDLHIGRPPRKEATPQ